MYFDEVKKNFGFGCMRLPMVENGKAVDIEQTKKMVDTFKMQIMGFERPTEPGKTEIRLQVLGMAAANHRDYGK